MGGRAHRPEPPHCQGARKWGTIYSPTNPITPLIPPLKSQYCQRQLSPNPAVQQMLCLYLHSASAPKKELPGSSLYPGEATQAGSGPAGVLLAAACDTRKPGLRKQCTVHMGALYKNQELHTNLGLTREACIDTRTWNCRQESPQFMGQF